ncbi:MAG: hypothetical protein FWG31_08820 [Oscillospiraceae bacterium]|nr:hypothetical protein [Oscillospiraceae bacterium]
MRKMICVLALFMTGELLSIPFAPLLALLLIPLMKPLTNTRVMERILAVVFIPAAAFTAAVTAYRLSVFVGTTSLPRTPDWLLAAVTVAAAFFLAFGGSEQVRKFSAFTLPLVLVFIGLSAVLLAGKLQSGGFTVPRVWERNPLVLACEGIALLGIMPSFRYKEKPFRAYLAALLVALGIGAAVWSLSMFTLGGTLAETVRYPFHTALRVAKGGELIGRIEAFLIPVCLCVAVVKTAACMAVIAHGVKAYRPPSSARASNDRFPETAPET